jgi:hypothetical protein
VFRFDVRDTRPLFCRPERSEAAVFEVKRL